MIRRRIVVDEARVANLVDRRLIGRAKRVLEALDDLDVVGQGQASSSSVTVVAGRAISASA
jgi:hypothetical protein